MHRKTPRSCLPLLGTNHFLTRKSKQDPTYSQLNSSTSLQGSNSRNLSHRKIGIIEHQEHTFITYPGKQPVEVESLEEAHPLHPPYKKPLPKQASTPLHRYKNPLKSILKIQIQIESLLMIWSPQPVQCRQILQILEPKGRQWQILHPSTEAESEQSSSSTKST